MAKVSKSDIRRSTTSANCVDLGKIRALRDDRKKKKRDHIKGINAKKTEVVDKFQGAYWTVFGGFLKLRTRRQFTTWTDKNGQKYARKNDTDKQRLWNTFQIAESQYGATIDDIGDYFVYAVEEAAKRYTIKSPRQVFGYVVNDGVLEGWFTTQRAKQVRKKANTEIKSRAESHAELFDRR